MTQYGEKVMRAVRVPTGIYEEYLIEKEKYDWDKPCGSVTGDDGEFLGCSGKCPSGQDCYPFDGEASDGSWVEWCMCTTPEEYQDYYNRGLATAKQQMSPDEFEQYKAEVGKQFE
jgi:hypothetical protein